MCRRCATAASTPSAKRSWAAPARGWWKATGNCAGPSPPLWREPPTLRGAPARSTVPRMIISSTLDYRAAAQRRLPPFLFHYIDGGAYDEQTLRHNVDDLRSLALRQRVLKEVGEVDLST